MSDPLPDTRTALPAPPSLSRPSRLDAEAAVRTLIAWTGDDPDREGLAGTPGRVIRAYEEFFAGYGEDPVATLAATLEPAGSYDGLLVLRDIRLESHCEHHIVPILGVAHVGYLPAGRVVGLSKLARVVDIFARRLQSQEALTVQIADTLDRVLQPLGVAVVIEAAHQCMTTRGVHKPGAATVTTRLLGAFRHDAALKAAFTAAIGGRRETTP